MYPKISFYADEEALPRMTDMSREQLKNMSIDDIVSHNGYLQSIVKHDNFSIVYISKYKSSYTVVIKLCPQIREQIRKHGDVIYCG